MIDLKKKCWREKVTAEITLAHVLQFARELGRHLSSAEVATFLNQDGHAQKMWMHMMQAGEDYVKSNLNEASHGSHTARQAAADVRRFQRSSIAQWVVLPTP